MHMIISPLMMIINLSMIGIGKSWERSLKTKYLGNSSLVAKKLFFPSIETQLLCMTKTI